MARSEFNDVHRAVLMLIREQHPELRWPDVAEVFNNIFHHETRTQHSLNQQWYHRNSTARRTVWETARRNISPQDADRYTTEINNAVTNLRNSSQARVTKQSERVLKWDRETRMGLCLLMEDQSLAMENRVAIFSELFRGLLTSRNIGRMSAGSLQHQYRQRNDAAHTTAQTDWNFILHGPETEDKLEMKARVKEFTEKHMNSSKPDAELLEGHGDVEEEDDFEDVFGDDFDQKEAGGLHREGYWEFETWEDWNQAANKLGGQFDGLPAYPSAGEVVQWTFQRVQAGESAEDATGIQIVWISTEGSEAPGYNGPQNRDTGVAMDNDGQVED